MIKGIEQNQTIVNAKTLIDEKLNELLSHDPQLYQILYDSARYSVMSGGKRLRPLLVIAVAQGFNIPIEISIQPSCALELIHVYSLIHDDLPCMDNDDFRRGVPTSHKVYGEGQAVLTGDFLLTYAFEVIAKSPHLTAQQKIDMVAVLSQRAGGHGMIGGQVLDILYTAKSVEPSILEQIHIKKTAALITAAFEFGGILGNATEKEMLTLCEIGQSLGLAFQIIDDVLDLTTCSTLSGKMRKSDEINQKTTYATLFGVEESKIKAQELLDYGMKLLRTLPGDTSPIIEIAEQLVYRSK